MFYLFSGFHFVFAADLSVGLCSLRQGTAASPYLPSPRLCALVADQQPSAGSGGRSHLHVTVGEWQHGAVDGLFQGGRRRWRVATGVDGAAQHLEALQRERDISLLSEHLVVVSHSLSLSTSNRVPGVVARQ